MEKLLTKREAAEVLNVHICTLERWIAKGLVKAIKVATWKNGKRTLRFKREDLFNIGQVTEPMFHRRKRKGA